MLVPIQGNFVGAELEWDRRLDTLGRLAWLHLVAAREWRRFGLGDDEAFSLSLSLDPVGDVAFFFVFSPRELRTGGRDRASGCSFAAGS